MKPFTPRRPAERGSAFILVLLALLILTFLGLSLVYVTETEMALGGNERVMNNTFFAAESGIHGALAKLLTTQDWSGAQFSIVEEMGPDFGTGYQVVSSRIRAVGPPAPAPFSNANEGEDDYKSFFVTVTSRARRVTWPNSFEEPLDERIPASEITVQSQRTAATRYLLSPLRLPGSPMEPFHEGGEDTAVEF